MESQVSRDAVAREQAASLYTSISSWIYAIKRYSVIRGTVSTILLGFLVPIWLGLKVLQESDG
jgi:hypothetical protein